MPWAVTLSQWLPQPFGDFGMAWAVQDGHEVERWVPRLHLAESRPVLHDYQDVPIKAFQVGYRLFNSVPALRDTMRLFRYTF